jgi:hypothetical protein
MQTQQSGGTKDPISIDAEFFKRLKVIVDQVIDIEVRQIAENHKVSVAYVEKIARGEDVRLPAKRRRRSVAGDTRKEIDEIEEQYKLSSIKLEARYLRVHFDLKYNNGYTFQTDDLEQLIELLETEADEPNSLSIHAGGNAGPSVWLHLGEVGNVARYTIKGVRRDVEHTAVGIRNLMRASVPPHSWLHQAWPRYIITTLAILSFCTAYLAVVDRFAPSLGPGGVSALIGFTWVPGWLGFLAAQAPMKRMRRAFPTCQFEFGPEKRRRATYRSIIWGSLSVILVPLALALLVG